MPKFHLYAWILAIVIMAGHESVNASISSEPILSNAIEVFADSNDGEESSFVSFPSIFPPTLRISQFLGPLAPVTSIDTPVAYFAQAPPFFE